MYTLPTKTLMHNESKHQNGIVSIWVTSEYYLDLDLVVSFLEVCAAIFFLHYSIFCLPFYFLLKAKNDY